MKTKIALFALILIAFSCISSFAQAKSTSPQSVRDVDRPTKQPFFVHTSTNFSELVTVPVGKVLVIESVSGIVNATGFAGAINLYGSGVNGVVMAEVVAPSYHDPLDTRTTIPSRAGTMLQAAILCTLPGPQPAMPSWTVSLLTFRVISSMSRDR